MTQIKRVMIFKWDGDPFKKVMYRFYILFQKYYTVWWNSMIYIDDIMTQQMLEYQRSTWSEDLNNNLLTKTRANIDAFVVSQKCCLDLHTCTHTHTHKCCHQSPEWLICPFGKQFICSSRNILSLVARKNLVRQSESKYSRLSTENKKWENANYIRIYILKWLQCHIWKLRNTRPLSISALKALILVAFVIQC